MLFLDIVLYIIVLLTYTALFTSLFVGLLHFLVPQLLKTPAVIRYQLSIFDYAIENVLTFISNIMGVKNYNQMLLKQFKFFVYIYIFGNLASFIGYITSYNADWENLIIWSAAISLIIHFYWQTLFAFGVLNRWVNQYSIPLSFSYLVVFFLELISVAIRAFSLTSRLVINTFSSSLYLLVLSKLLFIIAFGGSSFISNIVGTILISYIVSLILMDLVKITFQCMLYLSIAFYYISCFEC